MPRFVSALSLAALLAATALTIGSTRVSAAAFDHFAYQGYITDANGVPVNGTVSVTFTLYNAATVSQGVVLWTDTANVTADHGLFETTLGRTDNSLADLIDRLRQLNPGVELFLGIKVGTDAEMTPRLRISSVPFALQARDADTLGGLAPGMLDQSAHVNDMTNPHQITAATVGAATTAALATERSRIDGLTTQVDALSTTVGTVSTNTVLALDGVLTRNAGSRMDMAGTFRTTNTAGSFEVFSLGASGGSVLMGAIKGASAAPQLRFQREGSPDFVDIGQDSLSRFVIENQADRTMVSISKDNDVGIGQSTNTGRIAVNMPFVNAATVAIRGRTDDIAYLDVFKPGGATEIFRVTDNGIEVLLGDGFKPGGGSWATVSDRRAKKAIEPLDGALDRLLALRSVTFEYEDPASIGQNPGRHVGFVAQEVEEVFPDWVGERDGYLYTAPKGFESMTVAALRELREEQARKVARLEAENAALVRRLEALEARFQALEQAAR